VFSGLAQALTGPLDMLALSLMDLRCEPIDRIRDHIRSTALAALRPEAATGRPIAVAGYSFGGLIACDLVDWLVDNGVPVARLLLLDPAPIDSRKPLLSNRFHARLRRWSDDPRTIVDGARRRLLQRSGNDTELLLSPAARDLEQRMAILSDALHGAYRDGSVRLPPVPVSWIRSREMAAKYRSAATLFGTPIAQVDSAVLDTDHEGLHRAAGVRQLAEWWSRQSFGGTDGGAAANERPNQPSVHLRRDAFSPPSELSEIRESRGVDIVPTPFGATTYLITRYNDVKAMLTDHQRFSTTPPWMVSGARSLSADGQQDPYAGNLMLLDPPEHTRLRRMLTGQFNARRMALLEQRITEVVHDRLEAMTDSGGPADFMQIFALPISSLMICELLGVPYSDRDEFLRRGAREFDMTISTDERLVLGNASREYMAALVAGARRRPGDDILGMLVREHGTDLTDAELTGIASLVLLAGHETTANMIGLGTLALLRHPDQLAIVRENPDAVRPAVEELLRWLSVVQTGTTRFTTTEVEVAGVRIPAHQPVFASMPAANRDPAFISNPDTLDIRRGATGHLAFGYGIHHCLGAPLARMEMAVALPALLKRFPDLALAEPFDQVAFRSFHFIYGLNSLHVTW
jgi:cytochrome P450